MRRTLRHAALQNAGPTSGDDGHRTQRLAEVEERTIMSSHAAVHAAPQSFIRKYVFSTDHKVIGLQYIFLGLFSAVLGTLLSMMMRMRLAWPDAHHPILEQIFPTGFPGGVMSPE